MGIRLSLAIVAATSISIASGAVVAQSPARVDCAELKRAVETAAKGEIVIVTAIMKQPDGRADGGVVRCQGDNVREGSVRSVRTMRKQDGQIGKRRAEVTYYASKNVSPAAGPGNTGAGRAAPGTTGQGAPGQAGSSAPQVQSMAALPIVGAGAPAPSNCVVYNIGGQQKVWCY